MSDLEQISKQVSLLNKLIELLRMQEGNYIKTDLFDFGWRCFGADKFFLKGQEDGFIPTFSLGEAWNHPITQKAWSDELVKVARELDDISETVGLCFFVSQGLKTVEEQLRGDGSTSYVKVLEAILNKYGRSLNE